MPCPRAGMSRMTYESGSPGAPMRGRLASRSSKEGVRYLPAWVTLPPLSLQSFSDISDQPLPLQPFLPAQAFEALWQLPLPLQELTPSQWTLAESAAFARRGAPVLKI